MNARFSLVVGSVLLGLASMATADAGCCTTAKGRVCCQDSCANQCFAPTDDAFDRIVKSCIADAAEQTAGDASAEDAE